MNKKIIGVIGLLAIISLVPLSFVAAQSWPAVTPAAPPEYTGEQALAIPITIAGYVWGFFLLIAAVCFILAGYLFVTAGGNPESVTKARQWVMFGLIGVAIAMLSRGLIALVEHLVKP
jgi:FtsH-binding integral membrane protein